MPITQITETILLSEKKVCLYVLMRLICAVCVSQALIEELKRIIRDSEILKLLPPIRND